MINCSQVIVSCLDEATNNFLFTLGRLCAVFKTWRDEKMNDDKDKKNAIAMTENDAEDEEDEDTDELGDDPDQDSEQHSDTEQQEAHPPQRSNSGSHFPGPHNTKAASTAAVVEKRASPSAAPKTHDAMTTQATIAATDPSLSTSAALTPDEKKIDKTRRKRSDKTADTGAIKKLKLSLQRG
jgi:hypothetical protein